MSGGREQERESVSGMACDGTGPRRDAHSAWAPICECFFESEAMVMT